MKDIGSYIAEKFIYNTPENNKYPYIDGWQCMINSFILSSYFPWVCLILILNRKNIKKPVIMILVANWFFRAIGDILKASMDTRPREPDTIWPFSQTNWYVSVVLAHVFWFTGEIIGDWYPLVRTKIVTNDQKKMKWVYLTCGLYNFVKVLGMLCGMLNFPIDLKQVDKDVWITDDMIKYNIVWWSIVAMMQIASCLYDLSVINALHSYLVDILSDFKSYKKNVFLEKFKRVSEFRIILSMMSSLIFFPFVTIFVIFLIMDYKNKISKYRTETESIIEQLRIAVLNFNYALMYMDQILLRFYVKRDQTISKITTEKMFKNSNSKIFNNAINSSNQYNYKKIGSGNDLNELIIRQPSHIAKARTSASSKQCIYPQESISSNNNISKMSSSFDNENSLIQNTSIISDSSFNSFINSYNSNNDIFNNNNHKDNFNNKNLINTDINENNNNNHNHNHNHNHHHIIHSNSHNQNMDISQINSFCNYPRSSIYYLNNLKINVIDQNNRHYIDDKDFRL